MSRDKVFVDYLPKGWGTILGRAHSAHYYHGGYPICRRVLKVDGPYGGKMRVTRDSASNCRGCEAVLEEEGLLAKATGGRAHRLPREDCPRWPGW